MKEIWKDIKGYEGFYQVSNLGRIKSLSRNIIRIKKGVLKNGGKSWYQRIWTNWKIGFS